MTTLADAAIALNILQGSSYTAESIRHRPDLISLGLQCISTKLIYPSAFTDYRLAITAPDVLTPTVGTITTTSGGSLPAATYHARVTGWTDLGGSLPIIPAGSSIVVGASGRVSIPVSGAALAYNVFLSTATDPLYVGRVTAAEVAAGAIITVAATASAKATVTTGGTAGEIRVLVAGTQRPASTASINSAFIIPATPPVNCDRAQQINFDIRATFTDLPLQGSLTVVPLFINAQDSRYYAPDVARTLYFGAGLDLLQSRIIYDVRGNTGCHLLVREFVGIGANFEIRSSIS